MGLGWSSVRAAVGLQPGHHSTTLRDAEFSHGKLCLGMQPNYTIIPLQLQ